VDDGASHWRRADAPAKSARTGLRRSVSSQEGLRGVAEADDPLASSIRAVDLWWFASAFLVTAGAAVSAYLLSRSFALLASPRPELPDLCSTLFATSCDATLADPHSWILGVPWRDGASSTSPTLASLLFLARFLSEAFGAEALLAAWVVTLAGVVAGIVLSIEVLSERAVFCPLCYAVHAIDVVLLLAVHEASGRSLREHARLLGAATIGCSVRSRRRRSCAGSCWVWEACCWRQR